METKARTETVKSSGQVEVLEVPTKDSTHGILPPPMEIKALTETVRFRGRLKSKILEVTRNPQDALTPHGGGSEAGSYF